MAEMTVQNSIDYAVDHIYDAFIKHIAEMSSVYTHLNTINIRNASATAPAGPATYEGWVDITDPADPIFKIYNGSSWVSVNQAVVARCGILLEHMLCGYQKNCKIKKPSLMSTREVTLELPDPTNTWAVAYLGAPGSGSLYKCTSTQNLSLPIGIFGAWYIWAVPDAVTGYFKLSYTFASDPVPAQPRRYLGYAIRAMGGQWTVVSVETVNNTADRDPYPE